MLLYFIHHKITLEWKLKQYVQEPKLRGHLSLQKTSQWDTVWYIRQIPILYKITTNVSVSMNRINRKRSNLINKVVEPV